MGDIDLVPQSYRHGLWMRRWLLRLGIAYGLTLVLLGGATAALDHRVHGERQQLEDLQAAQQRARRDRGRIAGLRQKGKSLDDKIAILSELRGGFSAMQTFRVLDRALDENLWFLKWTFRRAGEFVEHAPETVERGYFLVVPNPTPETPSRKWRLRTHMEIGGQANDHSALARFVRRLGDQPEIGSVRVLNTRTRRYTASDVVGFELAISLQGRTE